MSSLMPPKKIFFTVKWARGLWESSLDTALFGSTTLPSTCVALHSWLHPPAPPWCMWQTRNLWGAWCLAPSLPHSLWAFPIAQNGSSDSQHCFKAQSSDEELPQLFGLFGRLWFRHDGSGGGGVFNDAFSVASTGRKRPWIFSNLFISMCT